MGNKYCYQCGNELSLDVVFCTNCGARQINGNEDRENMNHNIINNGYTNEKIKDKVTESSDNVSISEAVKLFWQNGFNFSGTSSRSEFWYWWLFQGIISLLWIPAFIVDVSPVLSEPEPYIFFWVFITILLFIWDIGCVIPTFALQARRLRDIGMNNLFITLFLISYLIPFINIFSGTVISICSIMPSANKKR